MTGQGRPDPAGARIIMLWPDLKSIPHFDFPAGFGIRNLRPDEGAIWTDVMRDAEPFLTVGDELFDQQFGRDAKDIAQRCFLVVNPTGEAVGTVSAWYDRQFPRQDYGRVHWLATRPAYQRRGLARAALSHTLSQLARWHERACLATRTLRLPAIRLYLQFGFVPYLDEPGAREAWREVADAIEHPKLNALLSR